MVSQAEQFVSKLMEKYPNACMQAVNVLACELALLEKGGNIPSATLKAGEEIILDDAAQHESGLPYQDPKIGHDYPSR